VMIPLILDARSLNIRSRYVRYQISDLTLIDFFECKLAMSKDGKAKHAILEGLAKVWCQNGAQSLA